jgi:ABC-type glycerol-3-phosphate transport system substrate-binding protein
MESSQSSFAIWRLWLSMLAQQNVAIVRNGQYSYGPAGEATLARISDWFRKGYAQAGLDYPASTSQFMGGGAAFMLNGVWEVPELVRASKAGTLGFDYGIVPLPKMYANASAWADSHAFAIPANAQHPPSPAKGAAVLRFVAYVSKHSMGWAEGGHIPAYRAVAESPEALALQPNAQYAEAAQQRGLRSGRLVHGRGRAAGGDRLEIPAGRAVRLHDAGAGGAALRKRRRAPDPQAPAALLRGSDEDERPEPVLPSSARREGAPCRPCCCWRPS